MSKRLTTEDFIAKAKLIHGDKYDYSLVNYINNNTKINIICKNHGKFKQSPTKHLLGQGCSDCHFDKLSKLNKKSTKTFVFDSIKVHGYKFDYVKSIYENNHTKLTITCKYHGDFLQTPKDHLNGCGCFICGGKTQLTSDEIIKRSIIKHNNKFIYLKWNFINKQTKVEIICPEHGSFFQLPHSHMNGRGCVKCSGLNKSNTIEFINKSIKLFGHQFEYIESNYKTSKIKIKIKHNKCGKIFWQRPNDHLSGYGCPFCISIISKPEVEFLNHLKIPNTPENRQVKIGRKKVDGYDPNTNTIYEFLGDYWHGNPTKYNFSHIHPRIKKSYGDIYNSTMLKFEKFKEEGYNIKYIWENDWNLWIKTNGSTELPLKNYPI